MTRFLQRWFLELAIFAGNRALHKTNKPCSFVSQGLLSPDGIPGLDASLCRCQACKARADHGIWWFDPPLRERILKKKTAYHFPKAGGLGDVSQESDQ